ncbi:protein GLUTAMINE DUMPER 3 [Sesamum alatum]|uniref:Protein GLUTAMINE DUMPER 3 n=1 Tax=Sesamum alatum TaxID=300844 RepID=A0AAE1YKH7_9LAMI|nr:protein GLUTAMINE DUMPER 3 [Sesamum alatum]
MATREAPAAPPSPAHQSAWNSPVPYLFGGLAAMLGLIALALVILACSYWKLLAENLESREDAGERDLEAGEADHGGAKMAPPVLEEKYLVIMAGQQNPTFLATPASSRASSFGSKRSLSTASNAESTTPSDCQEKKGESSGRIEMGNLETHDHEASLNQVH